MRKATHMRFGIPIILKHKNPSNDPITINIDYDAKLLSLIKLGISKTNPSVFKELYEKPTQKLFATSVYFPEATFLKDKIVLNQEGKLILFFLVVDVGLGLSFYNAFIYLHHLQLNKNSKHLTFGPDLVAEVWKLYSIEVPSITKDQVMFKTMSPIILRNDEGRFISCEKESDIEDFNKALIRNTITKLAAHPELVHYAQKLKFIPVRTRKTIRKSYGMMIEATKGTFELIGNPALLSFLLECGIGEKTGSFSGMMSVI